MSEETYADAFAQKWEEFKQEQPELALVLSLAPGSGQIAALTEYYSAAQRGDTTGGVMAALQFVPGGLKQGIAAFKEARAAKELAEGYRGAAREFIERSTTATRREGERLERVGERALRRMDERIAASGAKKVEAAKEGARTAALGGINAKEYAEQKFSEGFYSARGGR